MMKHTFWALAAGLSLHGALWACEDTAPHEKPLASKAVASPDQARDKASAQSAKPPVKASRGAAAEVNPTSSSGTASIVFFDPVTGERRAPTAEELKALQAPTARAPAAARRGALAASADSAAPKEVRFANGATGIDATEESYSQAVAVLQGDGHIASTCTDRAESAKKVLQRTPKKIQAIQ